MVLQNAVVEGLTTDYTTKKVMITLSIDRANMDALANAIGRAVDVRIEQHKDARSRNSNAYFHLLVTKLSEALNVSKPHAKNMLLTRYGQPELDSNGNPRTWTTVLDESVVREREDVHASPVDYTVDSDGVVTATIYALYRGSHTYNTKEMATLISGAESELVEMGIEV